MSGVRKRDTAVPYPKNKTASQSSSDSSSSDEDDDDLALDGELVRNSDVSSSSDDDDCNTDVEDEEEKDDTKVNSNIPNSKRKLTNNNSTKDDSSTSDSKNVAAFDSKVSKSEKCSKKNKNKKRKSNKHDDLLQVEFTFCDMDEKFFHGIKALLNNSSTVYQNHSSNLADLLIENISVGTVVSTSEQYSDDGTVFGFASVLNVSTYQSSPAIQSLKHNICLKYCPVDRKEELTAVLSGTTKRPAGFLLHSRMLNLPMELVSTLHEQLILDIDWAIENAEGGIDERKSLDFGVFVRIAPCLQEKQSKKNGTRGAVYYKYFDDEVLAGRAEYTFTCPSPSGGSSKTGDDSDNTSSLTVIVLTKGGHLQAIDDLKRMVRSS